MNINRILLILFGFFLTIEQGFTLVLGVLSSGVARGADVLMPVDLAMYGLFLLKPPKKVPVKYRGIYNFAIFFALLYLGWTFIGEFISIERADFRFGMVHLTRAVLVYVCILTRVSSKQDVIDVTKGVVYGLGFEAFLGVWQWQIGPISLPFFNIVNTWRVTGTFGVGNVFGCYIAALAPLAIRLALFTKVKPKWLWYIISAMSMGSLLATYTRGAWLSFSVSMMIFFYLDFLNKKLTSRQISLLFIVFVVGLGFVSVKYGHVITGRMANSKEAIMSDKKHSRAGLAKDAVRIIKENKMFGVGLNTYRYYADEDTQGTRIVHNVYLLIAAQQGIPGVVIFLILNLGIFFYGFKILRSKDPTLYHIGMAGMTGMMSLLIYYLGAPDYRLVIIKLHHWRALAMILAILIVDERTIRLRADVAMKLKARKSRNGHIRKLPQKQINETTL